MPAPPRLRRALARLAVATTLAAICGCDGSAPVEAAEPVLSPDIEPAPAQAEATPAGLPSTSPAAVERWLAPLLAHTPVAAWLAEAPAHRLQIVATAVDLRGSTPRWRQDEFRADAEYVYPASAIKTFMSVAALNALRQRAGAQLEGLPEHPFADAIARMQIASDNAAFGELYDFVGHRELNTALWELGFASVRMHHRMGGTREEGLELPRVVLALGPETFILAPRHSDLVLPPTPAAALEVGERHRTRAGQLLATPMSFADKNYVSLRELQRLNLSLLFPGAPGALDLRLHPDDRRALLEAMTTTSHGGEQQPLWAGAHAVLGDEPWRYVGKSGRAYGFVVANAYLERPAVGRGMFVTAAIYANPNGVVNDDDYDYTGTAQPFMDALGAALAGALLQDGAAPPAVPPVK